MSWVPQLYWKPNMPWHDTTEDGRFIIMYYSEEERDVLEATDWRLEIHRLSQYTDNPTQKCQQWPEYPAVRPRETPQQSRHMNKSSTHKHTPASPQRTNTHLSLSTLLKPGRMCLKLELRSSLGWLLVRFIEPFSRRLRKPCQRDTETVNKAVSPLVCEASLWDVNH